MRTALASQHFTCVSAPPGSGKTFLIAGIIAAKLEEDPNCRFAVCSSTNIAVDNAMETIHSKFPTMKKIRQFSRKAEEELDKNAPIRAISLRSLTHNESVINSLMENEAFCKAVEKRDAAQERMQERTETVAELLDLVDDFQRSVSALEALFIKLYAPTVYGTTGSILARTQHAGITHLIIDEATQMSSVDALAIYCSLPDLQQITVIGDSRQLGPFTDLEEGSLALQIMKKGELTRLEELQSSAKRQLEYIYRCNSKIMDLILKPIYGRQLKSGTPDSLRNLAVEKKLPLAKDGSPCLFVQVEGYERDGVNKQEADVVIAFLGQLKQKGISPEDVQIICHHRAQREILCQSLKDKGTIGPLNLMYGVNTVDSFQGKEAKIVLVLTTKTSGDGEESDLKYLRSIFSFVSDPQRETVAVSRAQHAIYLFGNWEQLAVMPFWRNFGSTIIASGAVVNEKWHPIENVGWKMDIVLNKVNKQAAKKRRRQLEREARN